MLQYCGLDTRLIRFAVERNPAKWGTKPLGIDVISEDYARRFPPEYLLILPWHFVSEFVGREMDYLRSGGRFIIPLPPPPCVLQVNYLD